MTAKVEEEKYSRSPRIFHSRFFKMVTFVVNSQHLTVNTKQKQKGDMSGTEMFPLEKQGKDCESRGGEILLVPEYFSF